MYIVIYSVKNYLFEFLSQETNYTLKHLKHLVEFNQELSINTPDLAIIDKEGELSLNNSSHSYSLRKPIDPNDLLKLITSIAKESNNSNLISINDKFILDVSRKNILNKENATSIDLTAKEAAIIKCLSDNMPNHVSKSDLLKIIWNYQDDIDTHTLETHIYRLRQKIGENTDFIINNENGYGIRKY